MKKENKSGVIFIEKRVSNATNPIYLCQCPICGERFEMWSGHYYRGDNPCKCNNYASKNKRLYRIWTNMKTRCYNKNSPGYKNYGGRGITICEDWFDFKQFYKWAMSNGYSDNLSIDRIDNNKGYSPINCRWTDKIVQANNKRNIITICVKGEKMSLKRFCQLMGLNYKSEHSYLTRNGYDSELNRIKMLIGLSDSHENV